MRSSSSISRLLALSLALLLLAPLAGCMAELVGIQPPSAPSPITAPSAAPTTPAAPPAAQPGAADTSAPAELPTLEPTALPDLSLFTALPWTIAGGHNVGEKLLELPAGMLYRRLDQQGDNCFIEVVNGKTADDTPTFDKVWTACVSLDQPQVAPTNIPQAAPTGVPQADADPEMIQISAAEVDGLLTMRGTIGAGANFAGDEIVIQGGTRYRDLGVEQQGRCQIAIVWSSNPDGSVSLKPVWVYCLSLRGDQQP